MAAVMAWLSGCGSNEAKLTAAAERHLAADDFPAAQIESFNILKANEESASGRLLLGRSMLGLGNLSGAEKELDRAARFGAPEARLAPVAAEVLLEQGRAGEVVKRYADTRLDDPKAAADLLTLVGRAHAELGDAQRASQSLEVALVVVPEHPPALLQQARLLAARGRLDDANALADEVLARQPNDAYAWILKGDLAARVPDGLPAALQAYRKAVELRPRLVMGHSGAIVTLERMGDSVGLEAQVAHMVEMLPHSVTARYYQAAAAFRKGDVNRANDLLQPLMRGEGQPVELIVLAGRVAQGLGALAQAEGLLERAIALVPDAPGPRHALVSLHLQSGQFERATTQIAVLLKANPEDSDALRLLGETLTRQGDFQGADAAFARAARRGADDPRLRASKGRSLVARGQYEAGLIELQEAAKADTHSLSSDLAVVATLMSRGDTASALKAVDEIVRKQPESPMPDHLRGRILQVSGDASAARAAYEAATRKSPRFLPAISSLAEMDLRAGQLPAARARYEAFLKLEPKNSTASMAMAVITRRAGGGRDAAAAWVNKAVAASPQDAQVWLQAINFHRQDGDTVAALSRARAAEAAVPDNPQLLKAVADAQVAGGDTGQASATLNRLIRLRPESAEAHVALALLSLGANDFVAARASAATATRLAPDWLPAMRAALSVAIAERDVDRARAMAREARSSKSGQALGWLLEGELEASLGNWPAAVSAFSRANEYGKSLLVAKQLYTATSRKGDVRAVAELERRWLREWADSADMMAFLAEGAVRRKEFRTAAERIGLALKLSPDDPLLLNNLANVQLELKHPDALRTAQRAMQIAPYLPVIIDTLAGAFAAERQFDRAIEHQSNALSLVPQDNAMRLRLARYYVLAGSKEKAKQELVRLTRGEVPGPERVEAEKLLRELGA